MKTKKGKICNPNFLMIINRLYAYLYKLSTPKFLLFSLFLKLFAGSLFVLIASFFQEDDDTDLLQKINLMYCFTAVIAAPLVETYIFQYLPLKVGRRFFRKNRYSYCIAIVLSACLFGSLHSNRFLILSGFILVTTCFVLMRKKQHPFLYTALLHSVYNAILIAIILVGKHIYLT